MATKVIFSVNTSATIAYTQQLEKLHRSAFPVAVRGTLNDAAFDMKKNTLQESAKKNFILRAPTFFKKFTTLKKATGFDVNNMQSTVGFTDQGQPKVDAAIKGMEDQEQGGKITTGLAYLASARISNSPAKAVRMNSRFSKGNIIKGSYTRNGGTTKSRFIAAAVMAAKTGKLIKQQKNGRTFYIQVSNVKISAKGSVTLTSKILYASRDSNNKSVKATHFNEQAAIETQKKMAGFYQKQAERQFAKYMK